MSRIMKPKPWGDEPAMASLTITTGELFDIAASAQHKPLADVYQILEKKFAAFNGFTKLERACIDLKVPDPDLPPELRELILESRRLDYAGKAIDALLSSAEFCKNVSLASIGMTKTEEQEIHPKTFSKVSWLIANAMLKELDKK